MSLRFFGRGYISRVHLLPQINAYDKYFKDSKYMNLLVNGKKVLQKYNEIWGKVKSLFRE